MEWCCNKQIKPLYGNIKYKDYLEPLTKYSKDNNNIFLSILKKKEINDLVIQYYIKSSIDISIIVIYPSSLKYNDNVNEMINILKDKGDIHYIKDLEIDYYMAYNLIFQLYANERRMKTNSEIIYKINRLGFIKDSKVNKIKIIVYTLQDKTKLLNGSSAELKMELRNIFVNEDIKTTSYDANDDRYPRGYDYLHVSDNNNQAYEYSGIFFHENSLKFLKKQKSWRLLEMIKSKMLFNKIKNFMYEYSQNELEKLMIFSSGVLFTYGIREARDLDCILLENNNIKPELIDQLNKTDMDISYKGTKEWSDKWVDELNKRAIIFGAKDYNDLVINPRFYYYFMGLKIIRLKCDLLLRFRRGRPAQMTDLLVIRQMFNFGYKLKIPETTTEYNESKMIDITKPVNKNKYLETIHTYLKTRYYINLKINYIEKWLDMNYNEELESDNMEYYSDLTVESQLLKGGFNKYNNNNKYYYNIDNDAISSIVYPEQEQLIKMGYSPQIIIYSSDKPYLYPGEDFNRLGVVNFCNKETNKIKPKKKALRIATFNLHNFISRCNQGIAPIFGTALNPFEKSRDIKKWLELFKSVNADILCLQELVPITDEDIKTNITDLNIIRNKFNFNYFNNEMKKLGYIYKIVGSTQNGKFYETELRDYYYLANGIYSKIELNNPQIFQYKYLNRNIITASIKYNNKIIQIFNTHLEYFTAKNNILINLGITEDHIIVQFKNLYDLINSYQLINNKIVCGDFNINLYKKNLNNYRYKKWEDKTQLFRNNFINTNRLTIPTNFSQNDQTDFIIYNKNSKIKNIYSFTVLTGISDHYMLFSDFI